ncbi:hypothetical protein ACS2QR_16915 [Bacillus cereus group sp. Bce026]
MQERTDQILDRERGILFVDGSQVSIKVSDVFCFTHKEIKFHDGNANEGI